MGNLFFNSSKNEIKNLLKNCKQFDINYRAFILNKLPEETLDVIKKFFDLI